MHKQRRGGVQHGRCQGCARSNGKILECAKQQHTRRDVQEKVHEVVGPALPLANLRVDEVREVLNRAVEVASRIVEERIALQDFNCIRRILEKLFIEGNNHILVELADGEPEVLSIDDDGGYRDDDIGHRRRTPLIKDSIRPFAGRCIALAHLQSPHDECAQYRQCRRVQGAHPA